MLCAPIGLTPSPPPCPSVRGTHGTLCHENPHLDSWCRVLCVRCLLGLCWCGWGSRRLVREWSANGEQKLLVEDPPNGSEIVLRRGKGPKKLRSTPCKKNPNIYFLKGESRRHFQERRNIDHTPSLPPPLSAQVVARQPRNPQRRLRPSKAVTHTKFRYFSQTSS